ncbi:MAG: FAD-dependent oxidoreductase [Spirochaetales bacterium]|nr:FAD-dependent oxidoreductase [Spirochaetales bacterium]
MIEKKYHSIVIGGGAAGLSAAYEISKSGFSVALIEREESLGGILMQCIHNGFGLQEYKEELTGPEYAERAIAKMAGSGVEIITSTTVSDLIDENGTKTAHCYSAVHGALKLGADTIVLAMGCRERNRGNIGTAGTRPAGIFTAGSAQRLINIEGFIPGKRVVIIGSGDIGLIMARRMTWVGAKVLAVVEILPYASGLTRNITQCLNDFNIPLYTSHIVSRIYGHDRVEKVDITPLVDGAPQDEDTFSIECDTILLSVGLIPENELSCKIGVEINQDTKGPYVHSNYMTNVKGVFACGNVLHVHDIVDFVTEEARRCAVNVVDYLRRKILPTEFRIQPGANVIYLVPNHYVPGEEINLYLRTFIVKNNAQLIVETSDKVVLEKKLLHVRPSEMIKVRIGEKDLARLSADEFKDLKVSIV